MTRNIEARRSLPKVNIDDQRRKSLVVERTIGGMVADGAQHLNAFRFEDVTDERANSCLVINDEDTITAQAL